GVGEFVLRVVSVSGPRGSAVTPVETPPGGTHSVTVAETASAEISALREFSPPKIASSHLSILNEFGQRLLGIDDPAGRLRELCKLMVRDDFHGRCAMVLRLSKERPMEQPKVLTPAEICPRWMGWSPYISRTLLKA